MIGDRYDVIVVGGGPAGTMAGAAAATEGAKTLVLERDATFGIPVRCGEGVAVNQLERFFPVNEKFVAARIKGIYLHAPNGMSALVKSNEVGLVLERTKFDRWLAERAASQGASMYTRCEVDGLISDNGCVSGVTYTRMGKRYKVTASVIIAADGVDSRVARWAGFKTNLKPVDIESAYQFLVAGIKEDNTCCHFFFGNEIAPGGYIWIFPKGDSIANIGIGVNTKGRDGGTAYRKLEEFVRHRYGSFSIIGEVAGGVPVAKPLKRPVKNGFLVAGDAAHHTNPLTGGGISAAMIAGDHAGRTAARAVSHEDFSVEFLGEYVKLIEREIVKPHLRSYRLKEGVFNLSDDVFNQTARQVLAMPPEKRTIRNIFLTGLASNPKLMIDIIKAFV